MARAAFVVIFGLFSFAIMSEASQANICWDQKRFNTLHPSGGSSVDGEGLPKGAELARICPTGNTSTLKIRCYDDHNNQFTGTQNITCPNAPGSYLLTCDATHGGMLCAPHDGSTNCTCPDYSAQFGCECAPGMTGEPPKDGVGQLRAFGGLATVAMLTVVYWIL